jgi:AcrR family transcriptional regulator
MSDTTPVKSGTKHKSEQERRSQILHSAMELFLEKGYHKTTMKEIMAATGLSKGAIYHYFSSKEEIFVAIIQNFEHKIKNEFSALADSKTPLHDIKQIMTCNLDEMIRLYRMAIVCLEMTDSHVVQESLDQSSAFVCDAVTNAIKRNYNLSSGLEADDIAFSFNMMFEGLLSMAATQHSFDARKALPKLLKVVDYMMTTPSIQRKDEQEDRLQ